MIYSSAIPYILGNYGEEKQLIQTAEEAAELAQAALKRHKVITGQTKHDNTREHLAEEIADVLIMIEQITYAEGFEDDVRKIIDEKISRQLDRIKQTRKSKQSDDDSWLMSRFTKQD